jgi:glycosyltransferase involved in cell wall biosynthesis
LSGSPIQNSVEHERLVGHARRLACGCKTWFKRALEGAEVAELISIIVTTYNREDALDAVLRSLARQDDSGFEVIIADDGSGEATAKLVDAWKAKFGRRLDRVWHTDRGFRAAEIRNRAILAAQGAYCVFLDGDCIVRPDFVATHRRLAEPGWFVTGNRVLLSAELTTEVLREKLNPESWGFGRWLAERWRGGVNRLSALLHLPLGPLRRVRQRVWQGARSCNLAIWRTDLDCIDGFDADYRGWGKEDSDIIVRLLHAGVRRKDGTFATGVLHLWHRDADRSQLSENERKLAGVAAGDRIRARQGLSALQGASPVTTTVS